MAGIDGQLFLKLRDRLGNARLVGVEFAEQIVSEWQFGIEGDGLLRVLFGDRIEFLPQQHLRSK